MAQLQSKIKLPFEKKSQNEFKNVQEIKLYVDFKETKIFIVNFLKHELVQLKVNLEKEIEYSKIRTVIKLQEQQLKIQQKIYFNCHLKHLPTTIFGKKFGYKK